MSLRRGLAPVIAALPHLERLSQCQQRFLGSAGRGAFLAPATTLGCRHAASRDERCSDRAAPTTAPGRREDGKGRASGEVLAVAMIASWLQRKVGVFSLRRHACHEDPKVVHASSGCSAASSTRKHWNPPRFPRVRSKSEPAQDSARARARSSKGRSKFGALSEASRHARCEFIFPSFWDRLSHRYCISLCVKTPLFNLDEWLSI